MDNYADAPKTITELRADKTGHAKDMTARDVMVQFLRDIDSGAMKPPDFIAVCMARREQDTGIATNVYPGGPHTSLEIIGLLEQCKHLILADTK